MKNITLLGIIFLSLVFARRDCLQYAKRDALGRTMRLEKDTLAISLSEHFYIHYDTTGNAAPDMTDIDGNDIPDYVDEVGIMADSARHVIVDIMGYEPEPFDSDSIYDIYVVFYGPNSYGHCVHEGNGISYLKIDNNYTGNNANFGQTPLQIMQIALVHEYFHAIQYGYQHNHGSGSGSDAYFYEMSSMWIEDVIVPDGNDYLEDMWVGLFLDNPEGDFDNRYPQCSPTVCDGEGYELALFGHYLSSFIDPGGYLYEKQSTIINKIWTEYSDSYHGSNNYDKPLVVINRVLQSEYQISFIEAWVDFITRNLYNGLYENMDNEFYYYPDQALIDPIRTNKTSIDDSLSISVNIDNESVEILTFEVSDFISILDIKHDQDEFLGNFLLLADDPERNSFNNAKDSLTHQLYEDDVVHLIYGTESSSLDLTIDIIQYTAPIPPSNLTAKAAQDSMILNWNPSPGPGDDLKYILYRNADSIYALLDTHYVDKQSIEGQTSYTYYITCFNNIGESQPSNTITIQSWPSKDNVTQNQILSIYPNPVHKTHDAHILYALETNYSNTILELINIRGQIVKAVALQSYQRGWHRQSINNLALPEAASGIYIIRLRSDNGLGHTQKITILP